MIEYDGLFFDDKNSNIIYSLDLKKLNNKVCDLHITFNRFPDVENKDLLGKKFNIELIAYGNNGLNSGFKVKLPEELMSYYNNYDNGELIVPHITTSYKDGSSLKHTKDIEFISLNNPITIEAVYSYKEKTDSKKSGKRK